MLSSVPHAQSPLPLRTTFIIAIVSAYVVIGALTVLGFLLSVRGLDVLFAGRFAQTQALLEKNRILSRIEREVALALKLADDPIIRLWAVGEDPSLKSLAMAELESYRRSFTDHSYFIAPLATRRYYIHNSSSANDQVQVTTLDPGLASDQWYFDTLRTVDSFALNVDYDRVIQAAKVWINVVLRDQAGRKIGVGGTGIDITDFVKSILQPSDSRTVTILVNRDGVIQAHPNAAYVLRNAETKLGAKITVYDLLATEAQRAALKKEIDALAAGQGEVASMPLTVEGRGYRAAISSMSDIGWFNIVLVDVSHVLQVSDFLPLGATILASLLLLLLVVAFILSRAVLRPLTALAAASREIAGGRFGIQVQASGSDEMGQLGRAFNTMSATVKSTTDGLEMRVQERTSELTRANQALEESQRVIMESLSYARRIQAGLLPGADVLARILPERLVIYAPRDMVGGDFYFVRGFPGHFVAAVIDCMGHGVPGAFMAMTVHAVLSRVLDAVCSDDPARIIAELDRELRDTLHRDAADTRLDAGLDIALCVCFPDEGRAVFAGAGLSVFTWDGHQVTEVKGEHRRVGYRSPGSAAAWVNRQIPVSPRVALYLLTDGYLDQAGGEKGFGFGRQRLVDLIDRVASRSLVDQEQEFRTALSAFQGGRPQRDDVTMIGFTVRRGGQR
jgi:serine phosphatase RsbU (regulator of sigma subunit)